MKQSTASRILVGPYEGRPAFQKPISSPEPVLQFRPHPSDAQGYSRYGGRSHLADLRNGKASKDRILEAVDCFIARMSQSGLGPAPPAPMRLGRVAAAASPRMQSE